MKQRKKKANKRKWKTIFNSQPTARPTSRETAESRNARLIDSGYQAFAREEGHFDIPDIY